MEKKKWQRHQRQKVLQRFFLKVKYRIPLPHFNHSKTEPQLICSSRGFFWGGGGNQYNNV